MTNMTGTPVLDYRGSVMFHCRRCGEALTAEDFFALGLRLPDRGESREDYCDAELLDDDVSHAACVAATAS